MFSFLFGICFGSFANVLIYRLPQNLEFANSRSKCITCSQVLGLFDLIPIASYIFLRGKCRHCGAFISFIYPFVEVVCGVLFVLASFFFPLYTLIPVSLILFMLLVISAIDYLTQEIFDGTIAALGIIGVLWVIASLLFGDAIPYAPSWYDAIIGAIAGGLPLFVIDRICLLVLKKDGFGYGDVKLMIAAGIFLGWQLTVLAFLLAFVSGGVAAAILMFTGKLKRGVYIAFGPFLALGSVISLFVGEQIIYSYFSLL